LRRLRVSQAPGARETNDYDTARPCLEATRNFPNGTATGMETVDKQEDM